MSYPPSPPTSTPGVFRFGVFFSPRYTWHAHLESGDDLSTPRALLDLAHEIRQCEPLVRDNLPRHTGGLPWAIDEAFVTINNVDDGAQLASVRAVVNQADPADLNVASVRLEKDKKKLN